MLWPAASPPGARQRPAAYAVLRRAESDTCRQSCGRSRCGDQIVGRRFEDHGCAVGVDGRSSRWCHSQTHHSYSPPEAGSHHSRGRAEIHEKYRAVSCDVDEIARCRFEDHISTVPADVRAEALAVAGRPAWPDALEGASLRLPDPARRHPRTDYDRPRRVAPTRRRRHDARCH